MRSLMDLYYREDNDGAEFPIPRVQGGDRQSVVI